MRPRRVSNLTRAALTAIALIALPLLASASAQAATAQQQIYNIFTSEYHAELAFSPAQMHSSLKTAQSKLAATASSIDALSRTDATAATALIDELEAQYNVTGMRPLFKASLGAFRVLVKLPLTASEHRDAVLAKAEVTHALAINTAADLAHWKAAGFGTRKEPPETKEFGLIIGVSLPSIDLPVSGSATALNAFTKLQDKASDRTSAAFRKVSDDWGTWIAGYGVASG